ncbi:MAG: acetylglutamate kinase [Bacteroidales bacterium]|jgi:acetylglutamate kinase
MKLNVFKIGGNVIRKNESLEHFFTSFCKCTGPKILVHGGGNQANELIQQLQLPVRMHEGRRITDAATLRIAVMVYAGWVNKTLVAALGARGCKAIGLSGADGFCMRAVKRNPQPLDFGYVGDIDASGVHVTFIQRLLDDGFIPVFAPITCDDSGQLLNTNADTIACTLSLAMKDKYKVTLHYLFDRDGVYGDEGSNPLTILNKKQYERLRNRGVISDGMIPKIETALQALRYGVEEVTVGNTYIQL